MDQTGEDIIWLLYYLYPAADIQTATAYHHYSLLPTTELWVDLANVSQTEANKIEETILLAKLVWNCLQGHKTPQQGQTVFHTNH